MGRNRRADGRHRRELLLDVRFLRWAAHEGPKLGGELALDGRPAVGFDLGGARRLIQRGLEALRTYVDGRGGNARAGDADDVGLDHHVVGTADEKEVLDIVSAEQKKLPLSVEIIHIHDAQPRLTAAAAAIAARHNQAATPDLAQHEP